MVHPSAGSKSDEHSKDDYQFEIPKGIPYLSGHFLELHTKKNQSEIKCICAEHWPEDVFLHGKHYVPIRKSLRGTRQLFQP